MKTTYPMIPFSYIVAATDGDIETMINNWETQSQGREFNGVSMTSNAWGEKVTGDPQLTFMNGL